VIAVDWGTSSLRCYRLDARGEIVESRSSGDGILNVAAGQFPRVLEKQIAGWKETPIVMSGMVGSRQGWKEAPYVKCPAGFDEIAAKLLEVRPGAWIVPGLSAATWTGFVLAATVIPPAIPVVSGLLTGLATATFRARPLPVVPFVSKVVIYGLITGVVSAVVSAPVVVYLFGGVTGSGSTFVVAFFLKTGQQLLDSVVLSGLATDPIDKVLEVLLAALLYRATPREFIATLAPTQSSAA